MKVYDDSFIKISRKELRSNLHAERKKKWDELKKNQKAGIAMKKERKKGSNSWN
jgi:hypothetical protein